MSDIATRPPHPNAVLAAEIAQLAREQLGWPPDPEMQAIIDAAERFGPDRQDADEANPA